jgi:hypothetical protein
MKSIRLSIILLVLLLVACASNGATPEGDPSSLLVTDGTSETTFSVADLEKLPTTEATFNDVTYVGVSLVTLLEEAGFNAQELSALKASATDGYSVNYDSALVEREDVIVAYATVDGALTEDDGFFRMVLPGEEGKLNIRMLTELRVIP